MTRMWSHLYKWINNKCTKGSAWNGDQIVSGSCLRMVGFQMSFAQYFSVLYCCIYNECIIYVIRKINKTLSLWNTKSASDHQPQCSRVALSHLRWGSLGSSPERSRHKHTGICCRPSLPLPLHWGRCAHRTFWIPVLEKRPNRPLYYGS